MLKTTMENIMENTMENTMESIMENTMTVSSKGNNWKMTLTLMLLLEPPCWSLSSRWDLSNLQKLHDHLKLFPRWAAAPWRGAQSRPTTASLSRSAAKTARSRFVEETHQE